MIEQVLNPAHYQPTVYAAPPLLAGLLIAVLGVTVAVRERGSAVSLAFLFVTASASLWLLSFAFIYSTRLPAVARWWVSVEHLGVAFIPSALAVFALASVQRAGEFRGLTLGSVMLSALFYLSVVFTDWFVTGLREYFWGFYPQYSPLSASFVMFLLTAMFGSLRLYWVEVRRCAEGPRRRLFQGLFPAFCVGYVAAVDLLPAYGLPLYPFGYLAVLGFVALAARALWRNRLVALTPAFAAGQLLDTMQGAVLVVDLEGIIRLSNRAATAMLGHQPSDLAGRPITVISPALAAPGTTPEPEAPDWRLRDREMVWLARDGRGVAVSVSAATAREAEGAPAGIVYVAQDISQRKQMQEALRESEQRFRSVLQSAPDAIVVADSRGVIISWNRAAERMFGYREEEILDQPLTVLMPERHRAAHQRGLERLRATGESHLLGRILEMEGLRRDGGEFPLELSLATWTTGRQAFYGGIMRDITDRRQAQEELERRVAERTAELQEANERLRKEATERVQAQEALRLSQEELIQSRKMEAVGKLAGGIAHEFNNLLTVIIGYGGLVSKAVAARRGLAGQVGRILQAAERAAALTRQLLAFGRKQILQASVLDLNELARSFHLMLERFIGEDIETELNLEAAGCIRADAGQLQQVLLNLVNNARDAMPAGGRLTITTADREVPAGSAAPPPGIPPGAYVTLSVRDTGIGMTPETRARIFEPFFTTKEVGRGTGLGLSTVYGIVAQSDGHIRVESEPGRGTTFTLYFPAVDADRPRPAAGTRPPDLPGGTETLLIVEDEPDLRALLRDVLESLGYLVLDAEHGEEAIRLCERRDEPIHLLVTDVVMPRMTGPELAERLRVRFPQMRILYISGYTEERVLRHSLTDSEVAFLHKPFTPAALARAVRDRLDGSPDARS